MKRLLLTAAALIAVPVSTSAVAETVAITNARVVIGDGSAPIEGGTVVIRDGRIAATGRGVAVPAGARAVDAGGRWVSPGLFAGFTRLGIVEVDGVDQTNDASARTSPFSAALDVSTAVNPRATPIAINRVDGVTRAVVVPQAGSGIFAGQGAIIDLGADMDAVMRARAFQYVELGEAGAGNAGGSRTAAHAYFRNALIEARAARPGAAMPDGAQLTQADALALAPVARGEVPLLVHVERASDILGVLDLKREFPGLRLVLVGASEGWTVAGKIAAAQVPVITGALTDLPAAFEQAGSTQSNAGRMVAAGVEVAIGMVDDDDARQARLVKQHAGNLVALTRVPGATGMDWGAAFAAISSKPAEIMGLGGELGSLKAGRRGDVVIWDGDPLEVGSAPVAVFVDGVQQPMETRQTKLRDRYRDAAPGALPKAYNR